MKGIIKADSNIEFDVIYSDGTKRHVTEGILFEACSDNSTVLHLGTDRPEVYIAYINGALEFFHDIEKRTDKKEKWCDRCHGKDDCEEKEEFLFSNDESCTDYA